MATIFRKLTGYEPNMDLSRMHDIAGARIVTPDLKTLRHAIAEARLVWGAQVEKESDYVRNPRSSGYRAHHIILQQDGFAVEVQFRTQLMHSWANLAENLSHTLDENYKHDSASGELAVMLSELSRLDARRENADLNELEWNQQTYAILSRIVEIVEAKGVTK